LIKFFLTRDVAAPAREDGNAGFDFFVPKFNEAFKSTCAKEAEGNPKAGCYFKVDENGKEYIDLPAGNRVCIPSGVKSYLSLSYPLLSYGLQMDLFVENKSGVATKKGLIFGAQVVDSDYAGEVHISVINTSNVPVTIKTGEKLIQFIHTPVLLTSPEEIDEYTFNSLHDKSARGEGGFGSTGVE
jgi:dUTP pyrophosphatase